MSGLYLDKILPKICPPSSGYTGIKLNKANLLGFACIIDRSDKKILIKDKIVSQIKLKIETFSENNLPEELKKINPTKPGSKNLIK